MPMGLLEARSAEPILRQVPDGTSLLPAARRNGMGGSSRLAQQATRDVRARTTVLINLAAVMERMDEQILPALYLYIGASFNATVEELGWLTLARALVQALSSPLGGILGHYYSRVWVTAAGCTIWGLMTAAVSATRTTYQAMFFCAINGVGLSMVIPSGQSLIADYYTAASRGAAFGALYLTGALGGMAGQFFATNMGAREPFGIDGWRFTFLTVAAVSLSIGAANLMFAKDPRLGPGAATDGPDGEKSAASVQEKMSLRDVADNMKSILSIPTFIIIVVQGIVGSIPWNAMVFFTMWMQLLGMSDFSASIVNTLFLAATAFGGLLGGYIGDRVGKTHPNHGRILVCQFSVFCGIPFTLLITQGLPMNGDASTVALYAVLLSTMGALKTWAAPACNNPIFAEIVPPNLRNMIYAFDRCFEGAIAACAAPLVGMLAQRMFGFAGTATRTGDRETDVRNARALGNAMAVFMTVPWTLCLILYTGLHFTYPQDRRVALAVLGVPSSVLSQLSTSSAGAGGGSVDSPRLSDSPGRGGDESPERQRLRPEGEFSEALGQRRKRILEA